MKWHYHHVIASRVFRDCLCLLNLFGFLSRSAIIIIIARQTLSSNLIKLQWYFVYVSSNIVSNYTIKRIERHLSVPEKIHFNWNFTSI